MRLRFFGCLLVVGSFFAVQAFAHVGLMPRRGVSGTHHVAFSVRAYSLMKALSFSGNINDSFTLENLPPTRRTQYSQYR